jgi:predicted porin
MKKTIIAASIAAAVAAPAAFADVAISGMVNPEFIDKDGDTGYAASAVNTDLVLTGSEDLGNGMTASFKYHMYHDTGTDAVADTSVALKGDFGTVVAGRMESLHESVAQAFLNIDASHDLDLENGLAGDFIGDRQDSALAYISPTVGGFHVGVAMIQGVDGTDSDSFNSASDVIAVYENAGLKVFANRLNADNAEMDAAADAALVVNAAGNGADVEAATDQVTADVTIDAFGASYKIGDLELRAMKRNVEIEGHSDGSANVDIDSTFYGAKYGMGAFTVAAGKLDDDATGDSSIFSVSYALSKRTSVYLTDVDHDNDAEGDVTSGKDISATAIGIVHTF